MYLVYTMILYFDILRSHSEHSRYLFNRHSLDLFVLFI